MEMNPEKEKPRIRQAGSAEAFLDSTAAGREHPYFRQLCRFYQQFLIYSNCSKSTSCVAFQSFSAIIRQFSEKILRIFFGILFPILEFPISVEFQPPVLSPCSEQGNHRISTYPHSTNS